MMKKLLLLITSLSLLASGCAFLFGGGLKDGYSISDYRQFYGKTLKDPIFQMELYKACEESGSNDDFAAKSHALCNRFFCTWWGFNDRGNDVCEEKFCGGLEIKTGWDKYCKAFDSISENIKGKGFRHELEYIKNSYLLCSGKKPVDEFVADWEQNHHQKCGDCVETTYERCELRAKQTEWLDRQKIEEQYKEKKAALCNGKLNSTPYKAWFEWAVCKEFVNISSKLNYTEFSTIECPVVSEIYLKAEQESCRQ